MTAAGVVCSKCVRLYAVAHARPDHGTTRHVCSSKACTVCRPSDQYCIRSFACSLCPVDAILTRMGAYDNMFSNSSTFKVELDEWSVIYSCHRLLHELTVVANSVVRYCATPRHARSSFWMVRDTITGFCKPLLTSLNRAWQRYFDLRESFAKVMK